jgi:hypothetical protein
MCVECLYNETKNKKKKEENLGNIYCIILKQTNKNKYKIDL